MNENLLHNNALASLTRQAGPQILSAIKKASARTGVNFAYLVEQAAAESGFDAKAKSRSSSATGLYQFIESTWLNMVKKHGHKYGLGEFAEKISDRGKVADKAARQEILDLRKNPEKAALLAAEFAAENQKYLQRHVGGEIGATELYFAHFMGAAGAAGFLNAMKDNPLQTAADLFPKAANANRNVFYDRKTGEARTLAGVYDFFANKFKASGQNGLEQAVIEDFGRAGQPDATRKAGPVPPIDPRRTAELNAARAVIETEAMMMRATLNPLRLSEREDENRLSLFQQGPGLLPRGPLFNPADLMLLAQTDLPREPRTSIESRNR